MWVQIRLDVILASVIAAASLHLWLCSLECDEGLQLNTPGRVKALWSMRSVPGHTEPEEGGLAAHMHTPCHIASGQVRP